ncbi:MAG TPA: glycosyltransferase family 4 protein [Mycobacteriales bacterium]|nr:glycosyltransferase family 4 protein [Mycobacteriales bacterium]
MRTLVVTNDFPPRPGGIQSYVQGMLREQPPDGLVVLASQWKGWEAYDAALPYEVVRHPTSVLLPTAGVAARAREVARVHDCTRVWFGAAAPLGLLARGLRRAGIERAVATTHGHEVGWAALPGARRALRRIGASVDAVTYLGAFTRSRLAPAFGPHPESALLPGGVDTDRFRADPAARASVRARHGLGADQPVVVCVSRLVPRKGQDQLIRALPSLRARVPGTALLIVGGGPDRERLTRLARAAGVDRHVVITGSVPWTELPAHYAAGDVFAMPCRSRRRGLEVEGLGIVYLEAAATGLSVVAGDSGGAPDAVLPEQTGVVVDGTDLGAITRAVGDLLADPDRAAAMGAAGRAWTERAWTWSILGARWRAILSGE